MAERNPTPVEALAELHDILLLAALETSPPRLAAQRYMHCRDELLRSDLRRVLPGFLQQCVTVYRFHDFIHLYHVALEARVAFIDEAMREAARRARRAARSDSIGDHARPTP
ncbi:MAG: hypothetical protein AB7O91_07920 [Sphingomonas sp.]